MALRMASPWKHPKTGVYYFRKRIPSDLVAQFGKQEEKRSLQTKDPSTAKRKMIEALADFEKRCTLLRQEPEPLTHKMIIALSGEFYRDFVEASDENPGDPDAIESTIEVLKRMEGTPYKSKVIGGHARRMLEKHGLKTDAESYRKLMDEMFKAMLLGHETDHRKALGDYSPDTIAVRFPPVPKECKPRQTLGSLYEVWLADHRSRSSSRRCSLPHVTSSSPFGGSDSGPNGDDAVLQTARKLISLEDDPKYRTKFYDVWSDLIGE